jgi:cell division protease FtsH
MPQNRDYSESTAKSVDNAVYTLVKKAFEQAVSILQTNRSLLDHTAEELLKNETLNQSQIKILKQEIVTKSTFKTVT